MALYGLLALYLWHARRPGLALVAGAWAVLVGFSRIYLGVHYLSDVLAALAVGVLWLQLVWWVRQTRWPGLAGPVRHM